MGLLGGGRRTVRRVASILFSNNGSEMSNKMQMKYRWAQADLYFIIIFFENIVKNPQETS